MNEEIFRKKSLDKVKSPENLEDYIRVSNPGIWILLISIIILLIGACVWGFFGNVSSSVSTDVHIQEGNAICFINEDDIYSIQVGQTVEFSQYEAVISDIGEKDEMGFICQLSLDSEVKEGFYQGKVIIKRYKPISFIIN